jgi:hypothetical protein
MSPIEMSSGSWWTPDSKILSLMYEKTLKSINPLIWSKSLSVDISASRVSLTTSVEIGDVDNVCFAIFMISTKTFDRIFLLGENN